MSASGKSRLPAKVPLIIGFVAVAGLAGWLTGRGPSSPAQQVVPHSLATRSAANSGTSASGGGGPAFDEKGQWPLAVLDAPALWSVSEGSGVKVAIVDTGVDVAQRDLRGAVLEIIGPSGDQSASSHGTAIAGLIAGRGSASDPGGHVAGLAPQAELIDVRVAPEASDATAADIATGIREAAEAGARVINVSLTVARDDPKKDLMQAVAYAQGPGCRYARGCLIVASVGAGTSGAVTVPGTFPGVLAVAGMTNSGRPMVASVANFTPSVVYAPGNGLTSTGETGKGGRSDGYVTGVSGNDYAAAYVSATAALLFAADPKLTAGQAEMKIVQPTSAPVAPGMLDPVRVMTDLGLHPSPPGTRSSATGTPGAIGPGAPAPPGIGTLEALLVAVAAVILAALLGAWWRSRRGRPGPPRQHTASDWDFPL